MLKVKPIKARTQGGRLLFERTNQRNTLCHVESLAGQTTLGGGSGHPLWLPKNPIPLNSMKTNKKITLLY